MSPHITFTRYVLAVQDLSQSVRYYQDQLGFTTDWTDSGWHSLSRGSFSIILGECKDDVSAFETNNHSYFAYVEIMNIDELYAELLKKDVEIISELADRPWGQREFGIRTIDGHRIMFGEKL